MDNVEKEYLKERIISSLELLIGSMRSINEIEKLENIIRDLKMINVYWYD